MDHRDQVVHHQLRDAVAGIQHIQADGLHRVSGIEDDDIDIDPQKSMAQYNASSLDIVEVVSASLRDLDIDIPRTQMAHLENINQLVDLLTQVKHQNQ